ncbi:ABC transporter permease [Methanosphaerula palustris]|uniref:Binding-protein-dependent transport systems inner membrane component n=1 Tax=Methanosphaerula palustris (strain ATCC BAA-1556 / DSM 19958 / E1-9c) TaxID=521011 RepID=B8GHU7_METPE|nr:ABC transporter permease [Methanosphaerula palustris]ACL16687.1 binding-protein-dependent transport systems inner membrane component [Methanosphaerula palustris E1-9c]
MVLLSTLLAAIGDHILLAYSALLVSILLAVPLTLLMLYCRPAARVIMPVTNLVQAVPSLAVVALIVPLIGIGFYPAVIAIVLRALLPLVKNTWVGLVSIDPAEIDAANGLGLTRWEILRYIRAPHALPPFFAGVRFAAILANSLAVLTAIIGSGGLGSLVFEGLAGMNTVTLAAGAVPAILLALTVDLLLGRAEQAVILRGIDD